MAPAEYTALSNDALNDERSTAPHPAETVEEDREHPTKTFEDDHEHPTMKFEDDQEHPANFEDDREHPTIRTTYSAVSHGSSPATSSNALPSHNALAKPSPMRLSWPWYTILAQVTADFIICLAPLTFFALGWCAFKLSGEELSTWGGSVQEWSLVAPTIFPIVFAAAVGRSTTYLAIYMLERGVSLLALEQLVQSKSISSAFMTQIGLYRMTLLGTGLVFLWALSPAGGQASLRLMSITTKDLNSTSTVAYMNGANQMSSFFDNLETIYVYGQINSVYTAALLGSPEIKNGPQDMWNNVKIPYIHSLNSSDADTDGWLPVPLRNVSYSSLLGYSVAGIPSTGISSFPLSSYYYNISCQKLWHIAFPNSSYKSTAPPDWLTPLNLSGIAAAQNVSTIFISSTESAMNQFSPFFLARTLPNYTTWTATTRFSNILLGSLYDPDKAGPNGISLANCTIKPVFVESTVTCKGSSCRVTKMRQGEPYANQSDFWSTDLMTSSLTGFFDEFSQNLPFAIPGLYEAGTQSTPTEMYLGGNEAYPFAASIGQISLYKTPIEDFSRRFSTIVNTYWLSSMVAQSSTGTIQNTPVPQVLQPCTGGILQCFISRAATANVTHSVEVYICHPWWLALLLAASTILFLVSVVGAASRWKTRAPDFLGFASSVARDNPYVAADGGNSAMDGLELTRALGDLRIRLADVSEENEYGHLAVSSLAPGQGPGSMSLRKGRLYL